MRYLIDTSSLIDIIERHWYDDLLADPRVSALATIDNVLDELDRLAEGDGARARQARAAARFARQTLKTALEPATQRHVDDALIATAHEQGWGIVSQDHALLVRAKEHAIPTLTLTRAGKIGD